MADTSLDSEVPDGDALLAFCDAVTGTDRAALVAARAALIDRLGPNGFSEAALIASYFGMNDRIANSMGIPLESFFLDGSADIREQVGANDFLSARNSLRSTS